MSNIKQTLSDLNISQRELAEGVGSYEGYISKILNGKQRISNAMKVRIENFLASKQKELNSNTPENEKFEDLYFWYK